MSCPHCDATAAFHGRTVHIWPPQGHTLSKLEKALRLADTAGLSVADGCLTVSPADHATLARHLSDVLSEPERRDCRLLVTEGEPVSASHIPRVLTTDAYITSVDGAWLEDILTEQRLNFAFQPIVDGNQSIHGHEALVRATRRDGTPISPAQLFDAAGTPSLLATLDRQARLTAVSHMAALPAGAFMFINFMPSTIYDPVYCLQSTAHAVDKLGMDPKSVVFEIVESDKCNDSAHLRSIVSFYRDHGYSVALDDFGTGYNNLSTLLDFSPTYIKIDKAIISRLIDDNASRGMVRDLVRQAGAQDTKVIAEGIETDTQFGICVDLGVDFFQGFYFAKPSPTFLTAADLATARD
jgi:EAL domain-containing protein (putative c-di-GMP-specific phosphodiesterase class I)